jgi:hypothetical protein
VDRQELNYLVTRTRKDLRLMDWFFETVEDEEQKDAHVVIAREARRATIRYNPDAPNLQFLVKHEMVHVLLSDMDFIACNGRSIEVMEFYNLKEERVCNVIAAIL